MRHPATLAYLAAVFLLSHSILPALAGNHSLLGGPRPWQRRAARPRTDQTAPGRAPTANGNPRQRHYGPHVLDEMEWRSDGRARLWTADFRSRKPGRLSVASRLVWANVLAYAAQVVRPSLTQWGIQLPGPIRQGQELYRLLTPVFLHGGLGHLFTNMYSLQRIGPDVEKLFGSGRFVATYVAAGVAGNVLSAWSSPNPSLGASGAVFGLIGAYYVFLSRHEWLLGQAGQRMTESITQTMGVNLLLGFFNPVIDNWGHFGGAIGGATMAYWFGPRLYLTDLSIGTSERSYGSQRVVVDRPLLRLPRHIERVPERLTQGWQQMQSRVGMGSGPLRRGAGPDTADKTPWRENYALRQRRQRRRWDAPNRSIKPRDF